MAKTQIKNNTEADQEKKRKEFGFGSSIQGERLRFVKPDGSFNVKKRGQSMEAWINSYHKLITMSWGKFIGLIFCFYFLVNFLFGTFYYWIGIEYFNGMAEQTKYMSPFWAAYFFSSQTLTTVGYGHISPLGTLANAIASIEALIGLMLFALITGLLYGRFSRPNPKVIFSDNALIAPYLNINGFMFRLVNEKSNQLIDIKMRVMLSLVVKDDHGKLKREYFSLPLERDTIAFLSTTWTIVHPIDEESPLYGFNEEDLKNSSAEFIITLEAINDTYSDSVYLRKSYTAEEVKWGYQFVQIVDPKENYFEVDVRRIHEHKISKLQ